MNRRLDLREALGLNRRTRNADASRKREPTSNGKSPRPKRDEARLARFEQLEERALLAVFAAERAVDADFVAETVEWAERELSTLDLTELNAADMSAATALLDSIAQTPATFETILAQVFAHYTLTMTAEQHALVGSTLRSYLSYLKDQGKIGVQFVENRMEFVAK